MKKLEFEKMVQRTGTGVEINYLKHDYCWYNRLAIKVALIYWHNKLLQAELNSKRYAIKKKRLKLERKIK